jgi:serine protease AprX
MTPHTAKLWLANCCVWGVVSPKTLRLAGVALIVLCAHTAFAQSRHSKKVDRALQESLATGAATQHVIITVDDPAMRNAIRESLKSHGDLIESDHPLIGAFAAQIHSADVDRIANHPGVHAVSSNAVVSAGAKKESFETSWAPALSTDSTGQGLTSTLRETLGLVKFPTSTTLIGDSGIGIALIDSGIAPSADFTGKISGFFDFTHGGIPTSPFDDYGHGTHIAGLIASSGVLSNYEFIGIAPGVRLVGLKVLDKNGQGKTTDVIKAIEYVVANRARMNVHIINLSLGHPIFAAAKDDPLVQAVEAASRAGLIVVTSAGNFGQNPMTGVTGYAGIASPGNAPSAITVGAAMTQNTVTRGDDLVAPYSSRGPAWYDGFVKPDVVAPGHHLASDASVGSSLYNQLVKSRRTTQSGQVLLELSGTSMAAGVTTGVVALILDAHNRTGFHRQGLLTSNEVKAMLQFSALRVPAADYLTQGAGEINAAGAIALASNIDTSTSVGEWWLRGSVPTFSVIGTTPYVWSQNILWGDSVYTGSLLYYHLNTWSQNILWGSSDDNIVWGSAAVMRDDNIVWGSNILWGSNVVWGNGLIGMSDGDNIVWGSEDGDNIVWGSLDMDNIVWGSLSDDNILWGSSDDNILWGSGFAAFVGGLL